MNKILLTSLLYLISIQFTYSQTYATDFTEDDCSGVSHNLFNELDAGNIIVISFVMPCGPCATYSLPAYDAAESFATSHPGKVHFYIADDHLSTACVILENYANNYNMSNSTIFSNSNIAWSDYGTYGMPKVIVLGGSDHLVYLNKNENKINYSEVHTAISNALADGLSSLNNSNANTFKISTFPNPVKNNLTVSYSTSGNEEIKIEIIDLLGKSMILKNNLISIEGSYSETLDLSSFKGGMYFIKISSSTKEQIKPVNILN
jgi:hypothetical protein|tara:strand:+ start:523 stop:1308 length:786 start_codon:yes stop_codon:yes gene_type:complete